MLANAGCPVYIHTYTRLTALCPGLPGWAGTRKVKPIWISLKQETVSGSGISWAVCKSAPRSRQITTPAPHHSVFLQAGCPSCRPTVSKHWRQVDLYNGRKMVVAVIVSLLGSHKCTKQWSRSRTITECSILYCSKTDLLIRKWKHDRHITCNNLPVTNTLN